MRTLIVFAVLLAALFATAYFTKRRFGVLGLALCAGSLLSASWASSLTPLLQQQGIRLISPPLSAVVAIILILLPPALLLFSGPTYNKPSLRIGGAAAFALLAFVFILDPLGSAIVLDSTSMNIYATLTHNTNIIIVAGIVLALVDMLMTRTPHFGKEK